MDQKDNSTEVIKKRLDIIIALLLNNSAKKRLDMDTREQIGFLASLGLKPIEIAVIMNKKTNYINKELHFIRKK